MDWITCTSCEEEFKVITDSSEIISYCPLCGNFVEFEDEEEDFEEE